MLTPRQSRPVVAAVFATFQATSTTPPKPVAAAHDRFTTVVNAFNERAQPGPDALTIAVLAAIEDNRDPAMDPDVQRIIHTQNLASRHNLADDLGAHLLEQLRDACTTNTDAIIGTWRRPFATAATALGEAHHELGAIDLTNTDAVVRKGTKATAAWHAATEASRTIVSIDDGWRSLHTFLTGGTYPVKGFALLRIANVDPGRWLDRDLGGSSADPWTAVLAGHPLALPTIDEYRQRIDSIERTANTRFTQAEQADRQRRRPSILAS